MMRIAIINRSFWPRSSVIGESLLQLAEQLVGQVQPVVIAQVGKDFREQLQAQNRGEGVRFSTLPSMTSSASPIFLRVLELMLFTVFVFFSLCRHRPDKVYVATNPPIFVPMAVRWYCRLFKKKYIYHLQDIHPEATEVVTGRRGVLSRLLKRIDNQTIKQANTVITLTEQMKDYIHKRTGKNNLPIVLLDNASVQGGNSKTNSKPRIKGFVYCGNAGRLQRIPLLIESIRMYIKQGGKLPFVFAGGGIYRRQLEALAAEFEQVTHMGVLPAEKAAELLQRYTYGLLPIEDEVTNYAFPSKSSSYVFSGCKAIAICGAKTSVARWVEDNGFGYVVAPEATKVVRLFLCLESSENVGLNPSEPFMSKLTINYFNKRLLNILEVNS